MLHLIVVIIRLERAIRWGSFFYIIVYKGDVRRIHRNITAYTAHGNANLSFFQGRSIIDPIADHTHQFSLGLVDINSFQFIFRQTVGPNCPDMELRGDGVGGIFMVTCEQHRIYIQTGSASIISLLSFRMVSERAIQPARLPSTAK